MKGDNTNSSTSIWYFENSTQPVEAIIEGNECKREEITRKISAVTFALGNKTEYFNGISCHQSVS